MEGQRVLLYAFTCHSTIQMNFHLNYHFSKLFIFNGDFKLKKEQNYKILSVLKVFRKNGYLEHWNTRNENRLSTNKN